MVVSCTALALVMLKYSVFESPVPCPSTKMVRKKRLDTVKSLVVATIQLNPDRSTALPTTQYARQLRMQRFSDKV